MPRVAALAFALAFVSVACATSNEPKVSREETEIREFRARVAAVDQKTRVVTLVDDAGNKVNFRADEAVKNLPQMQAGDMLVGEEVESLAVEVRPATAEELATPESVTELVSTAEPGQKPAGLFVRQVKALYTIESIDKPAGGGTLRDSRGASHFVKVREPSVLDRVKVGDTVVVTLTEALRVEVMAPDALRPPPHARRRLPRDGDGGDAPRVRRARRAREAAAELRRRALAGRGRAPDRARSAPSTPTRPTAPTTPRRSCCARTGRRPARSSRRTARARSTCSASRASSSSTRS